MQFLQMLADKFLLPLVLVALAALIPLLIPKRKFKRPWLRSVAALALVCIAGILVYFMSPASSVKVDLAIAGTVIDESTQASIPGANISVVGRSERCVSESNGNFRLQLDSTASALEVARLNVEKSGYMPYDVSVRPGVHNLVVQLRRAVK
jgi:hypothetical protein